MRNSESGIAKRDWDFSEIVDARRRALERARSSDELISELMSSLTDAIDQKNARLGVDHSRQGDDRIWIQFQVEPSLYDWFYSARTGYRAHYWVSPECGAEYNTRIIEHTRIAVESAFCDDNMASSIRIGTDGKKLFSGPHSLTKQFVLKSLGTDVSKIWPCEWLISDCDANPVDTGIFPEEVPAGVQKLRVTRWGGKGLLAPYPTPELCWLDIKGGFVGQAGAYQIKQPECRAQDIYKGGWT